MFFQKSFSKINVCKLSKTFYNWSLGFRGDVPGSRANCRGAAHSMWAIRKERIQFEAVSPIAERFFLTCYPNAPPRCVPKRPLTCPKAMYESMAYSDLECVGVRYYSGSVFFTHWFNWPSITVITCMAVHLS